MQKYHKRISLLSIKRTYRQTQISTKGTLHPNRAIRICPGIADPPAVPTKKREAERKKHPSVHNILSHLSMLKRLETNRLSTIEQKEQKKQKMKRRKQAGEKDET
jgi:hypothetical protein